MNAAVVPEDARIYDLAQEYWVGMPHHPNHPPFLFGLTKKHGDMVSRAGTSSAADSLAMSGHCGTHIDALCHFSCAGRWYDGRQVRDEAQGYDRGIDYLAINTVGPIIRRGVLLDIAAEQGVERLPAAFVVTPLHLERAAARAGVAVRQGDVVLLRTGWGALFADPARYVNGAAGPGPKVEGARWLSERKVFAAGADTLIFEHAPDPDMPVHVHLLVESGIHIIENLALEELARDHRTVFQFIAAPLKIRGGTGSPIRPLALPVGQPSPSARDLQVGQKTN
jgi:kynurenine formamidase